MTSSTAFTLREGASAARAVAVRRDRGGRLAGRAIGRALERVPIAANLRLTALTETFANDAARRRRSAVDGELRALWQLAQHLPRRAARPTSRASTTAFDVDWNAEGAGERGRVDDRPAPARQSARQARRRADDPRQQHVGTALADAGIAGPLSRAGGRQGQDEHAPRRAPGPRRQRITCGRARRCGATATSSTSGS